MVGNTATSRFVCGRERDFAGVALVFELIEFVTELAPQGVKVSVVMVMNVVAELMKHDVDYFVHTEELPYVSGMAQAKTDLLAVVVILAEETPCGRPELGQDANFPTSPLHDGFDHRSDLPQYLQSLCFSRPDPLVLKFQDQRVVFKHLEV